VPFEPTSVGISTRSCASGVINALSQFFDDSRSLGCAPKPSNSHLNTVYHRSTTRGKPPETIDGPLSRPGTLGKISIIFGFRLTVN
jgi:hypothetical protein